MHALDEQNTALLTFDPGAGYRFLGTKVPSWEEPNPFYALRDFLEDSNLPKPTILFACVPS